MKLKWLIVVRRLKQRGMWGRRGSERTKINGVRSVCHCATKQSWFHRFIYRMQQVIYNETFKGNMTKILDAYSLLKIDPTKVNRVYSILVKWVLLNMKISKRISMALYINIVILLEAYVTGNYLPSRNDLVHHVEKYPTPPPVYSRKHGSVVIINLYSSSLPPFTRYYFLLD
ncbi:unnamed protein product [Eruca vesicaria subsp. sativa]|uniref:Uncharacterized protein n=1 Tax=Eruca vesicaria subsp. sativa TaxID=29727 RepID=A0ABC8LF49_ERUVS|nr:unnamed protein product [Eruca vesicaria subsp. sativa]